MIYKFQDVLGNKFKVLLIFYQIANKNAIQITLDDAYWCT